MTSRAGLPAGDRRRRDLRLDRGAAAVEGALVFSLLLAPLLLGVLFFGRYFWNEQQTALYPPRLSASLASGYCTSAQIVDRVKSSAAASLYSLNARTLDGLGISQNGLVDYLDVTVQSLGSVGADVTVSLKLPNTGRVTGAVPGRTDDLIFRDTKQRLSYVSVSTNGTSCSAVV